MYIRTFEKKHTQKKSAGKKTIEEKQTILLGSFERLRFCIRKCFIMWNVQLHSITLRSRNDLENGCL